MGTTGRKQRGRSLVALTTTLAVALHAGTNVSALVATFTTTGTSVAIAVTPQTSGVTANNFTDPVTYTVTAADGTTQPHTVTVAVAAAGLAIGDAYEGGVVADILQPGTRDTSRGRHMG